MARLIPAKYATGRLSGPIKRALPRTLLGRSLMIIVMPLILLQIITAYTFYERHWETVMRRLSSSLAGDIAFVIHHLRAYPTASDQAWMADKAAATMALRITFWPGEELVENPPTGGGMLDRILTKTLAEVISEPFRINTVKHEDWVEVDVQILGGVLQFLAPRKRLWSVTTYIFILWMVGSAAILFAIATVFMRNQVRPIRRLAAAAEEFGKGREAPDFKPAGALEVRQAATAFNIMRQRITRQISQRTEMLAGVSHDLRTPLTRMKLQLAMLPDGPEVEALRTEVSEMQSMVEVYLAFAAGEGTEAPVRTDLFGVLEEVADGARRKGTEIDMRKIGDLTVPVRPNAMKRCLTNLVENASSHGDTVEIHARKRGGSIEILIDDDGPGIPRDQRTSVFKPFFRLDEARNPDTGGVGLGLTIARDVVRGHGGDIKLGDSPHGGLRVMLNIPI